MHYASGRARRRKRPTPRFRQRGLRRAEIFGAWWLAELPRGAESTRRTYMFGIRRFTKSFDGRRLDSITPAEVAEWARANRWATPAARAMYSDAQRIGIVRSNPFAGIRLRGSRGRRDLVPLTPGDVEALAAAAGTLTDAHYARVMRAIVIVAAWTGLRPGELLALEREDVSPQLLTVRQSLTQAGIVAQPKNGAVRNVALPACARSAIDELKSSVAASQWIFPRESGELLTYWVFLRRWFQVRTAARRESLHFYELRHFCASQLLAAGVSPKQIALQLGHRDGGGLVLSTYGHLYHDEALNDLRHALESRFATPQQLTLT